MKRSLYIFVAVVGIVPSGCGKEGIELVNSHDIVLVVNQEVAETKTLLQDSGTQVYWNPGDEILVYSSSPYLYRKFVSQNQELTLSAEFKPSYSVSSMPPSFVVMYPYEGSSATKGTESNGYGAYEYRVTSFIPSVQTAVAGSFERGSWPTATITDKTHFTMYAVAGGLRFTLQNEGIAKIVFSGNANEAIAGKITSGLSVSNPVPGDITPSVYGSRTVTLLAPDGQTLVSGTDYYLVLAAVDLEHGFTIDFWKSDGTVARMSTDKAISVKRGVIGNVQNIDATATAFKPAAPDLVDLGLSVKWASCNVGALAPEELGGYYSWGETKVKSSYGSDNYLYTRNQDSEMYYTKYCFDSDWGYNEFSDMLIVLEESDDVANYTYGEQWRMPTAEEFRELSNKCTWTKTELNGVSGYRVTSKVQGYTDQSIFMPIANYLGDGKINGYWSSSLAMDEDLGSALSWGGPYYAHSYRYYGMQVRPVFGVFDDVTSVTLDSHELELEVLDSYKLHADVTSSSGQNAVKWSYMPLGKDEYDGYCDEDTGEFEFYAPGTYRVLVRAGRHCDYCTVTVPHVPFEPVDLGLSVLWSPINLGARHEQRMGSKYAYGDLLPKSRYLMHNYWMPETEYGDDAFVLSLDCDAARANLHGRWRMPTASEWRELMEQCSWTKEGNGNNACYKITSNVPGYEDQFIYLTSGEYDFYWSSTSSESGGNGPISMHLSGSDWIVDSQYKQYEGGIIRPVKPAGSAISAVDLGLSVKWASCNVGADSPEEYGNFFAWGETVPKSDYSWLTHKWCNGDPNRLTKYCYNNSYWDSSSPMDNKTVLDPEDDAARVNLGGSWRMPTEDEWLELKNNCTWTWTGNYNGTGISGQIVSSNKAGYEDKSIFLPAAGEMYSTSLGNVGSSGYFWSSSLNEGGMPWMAVCINFDSSSVKMFRIERTCGFSVRPVK